VKIHRFTTRDARRVRWLIEIWDTGDVEEHGEYTDMRWEYRVTNEDASLVFSNIICTGKSDEVPDVQDIMMDVMTYMLSVTMTFSACAENVTDKVDRLWQIMPEVCRRHKYRQPNEKLNSRPVIIKEISTPQ
jgi:hypothetical protein